MERTATAAEVRYFYKRAGHAVRISKDGHVTYRLNGEGPWLEGRFVTEYRAKERGKGYSPLVWLQ